MSGATKTGGGNLRDLRYASSALYEASPATRKKHTDSKFTKALRSARDTRPPALVDLIEGRTVCVALSSHLLPGPKPRRNRSKDGKLRACAIRKMFSVLIFFAISSSRSEAGVLSVCQLASRIFEGKLSVVHHFIDSRHIIHGFAKCFEKCPGNAPAFYSFNVSTEPDSEFVFS